MKHSFSCHKFSNVNSRGRNSKKMLTIFMIIKITFSNLLHGRDFLCFLFMNYYDYEGHGGCMVYLRRSIKLSLRYATCSVTKQEANTLNIVQWNPVNTRTPRGHAERCPYYLSVLSRVSQKTSRTRVLSIQRLKQTFLRPQNVVLNFLTVTLMQK